MPLPPDCALQTASSLTPPASDWLLLDVRSPGEFAAEHAAEAHNLPLPQCQPEAVSELARGSGKSRVLLLCQSGSRARRAAERLGHLPGLELAILDGGLPAWTGAGLPSIRGRGSISLERQVRIVAGILIVVGVAAGWWLHPGFFGLAAFVGAGLIFAGVTNFCGMGLLLARMPWNTRAADGGKAHLACSRAESKP